MDFDIIKRMTAILSLDSLLYLLSDVWRLSRLVVHILSLDSLLYLLSDVWRLSRLVVHILSLDYCHVNDNLLYILSDSCRLTRLVVHVHGIMEEHPGTTEAAWTTLTRNL
ncbi:hypothetical protein J6590_088560 [Homalodisca vitripennis]|nr:hypothetical protein J6590_088560 [Homalodisca vitripennis]